MYMQYNGLSRSYFICFFPTVKRSDSTKTIIFININMFSKNFCVFVCNWIRYYVEVSVILLSTRIVVSKTTLALKTVENLKRNPPTKINSSASPSGGLNTLLEHEANRGKTINFIFHLICTLTDANCKSKQPYGKKFEGKNLILKW